MSNVNLNDLNEKVRDTVAAFADEVTPAQRTQYLRNQASIRVQQACGHWVTEDWLDVRDLLLLAADYLRAADRVQYVADNG